MQTTLNLFIQHLCSKLIFLSKSGALAFIIFTFALSNAYAVPQKTQTEPQTITTQTRVTVAVLATRGHSRAIQRWQPTLDWLEQHLPSYHFQLQPANLEQMEDIVRNHKAEFVITNPGQAVLLGRQYPLSWIATLKSPWEQGTSHALGSALIVHADNHYTNLQDLEHSNAVAVSPNAFGGFLTLKQYLKSQQQDTVNFFHHIDYVGFPLDAMLYQLRDNKADVAIAPACLLENMVSEGLIDGSKFRVINNISPSYFPCAVSTPLYPNWSFAKTSLADETLATEIAKLLLNLPSDSPEAIAAQSLGWASPISPHSIDTLYRNLDIHPLQATWSQQALLWIKQHQEWAWGAVILFILLNCYHFWLEYRFSRSKKLLLLAQQDLNQKSQMLEHAQRVAIVGGLGSHLAHEINQPLSAIRNYSQGAKIKISRGASAQEVSPIIEKIEQQVIRVDAIVQRLRNLINKRPVEKKHLDIKIIIDDTLAFLQHDFQHKNINVQCQYSGQSKAIEMDPVGMQQVLINLLNNAADACLSVDTINEHKIMINVTYSEQSLMIEVQDNGPGLAQSTEQLQSAFVSTKEKGLGLGLSICRDIVENHDGQFSIHSIEPQGCNAQIQLPYKDVSYRNSPNTGHSL